MASTFSQIKSGLDAISRRIVDNRNKVVQAKTELAGVSTDLVSMGTEYSQLIADIAAALTATPNDVSIQNAKAESDRLVAEFNALKTICTNAQAAITA
jgi:hypothetical protein